MSLTTTVNYAFGSGLLSSSTGIVLNDEMDDFSIPSGVSPDKLPPAPSNFISPNKRPLSSMTPIIVLKVKLSYITYIITDDTDGLISTGMTRKILVFDSTGEPVIWGDWWQRWSRHYSWSCPGIHKPFRAGNGTTSGCAERKNLPQADPKCGVVRELDSGGWGTHPAE